MSYNYLNAVIEDVKQAIDDNYNLNEYRGNREELENKLNDDLWIDDSVTGNASGSYYCNTWKAEESLAHNLDTLAEVASEWGIEPTISDGYEHGAEWWDVTIRCFYLSQAIASVLDDIEESGQLDEIEEEPNEELINLASQYKASEPETVKAAETVKA